MTEKIQESKEGVNTPENLNENHTPEEEILDYSIPPKYELSEKEKNAVTDLAAEIKFRASPTNEQINDARARKETGAEKEKYEAPVVSMQPRPRSKIKNAFMGFAALLGIGASTTAKAEMGNLNDSTKNKIENIKKNPEDSLKKKSEKVVNLNELNESVPLALQMDWNKYIDWLASNNLKGSEKLDHGGLGMEMLKRFIEENPDVSLEANETTVINIQKAFSKYREWVMKRIEEGKAQFGPGANKENFMRALSIIDGIPGQRTTSFKFPEEYLITLKTNVVDHSAIANKAINSGNIQSGIANIMKNEKSIEKVENKGFAIKERDPIANSEYVKNDVKKIPKNKK